MILFLLISEICTSEAGTRQNGELLDFFVLLLSNFIVKTARFISRSNFCVFMYFNNSNRNRGSPLPVSEPTDLIDDYMYTDLHLHVH